MSVHFFTCTKQKKFLNLQVEIILGIISIIILSSLIVLNRSIIIFSESSTHQISLACCFPKVDSVITFDFFFNIIWFILISFGHQTLKKAVFDITVSIKLLFERVWWEFCLILCSVILSTPGIHMYYNYLLTTKVTALRVVRTSFQLSFIHFRSSQTVLITFPYLPWYWPWVHVNDNVQPEGVKLSPLCPGKIGFSLLVPGITDSKWN